MFGLFKSTHAKETEFAAECISYIYNNHKSAFTGVPQSSRDLLILDGILKIYFAGLYKTNVYTLDESFEKYESVFNQFISEIKSGRQFGLQDVTSYIIIERYGLHESITTSLNRIIQEMYKHDVPRFVIEGKNFTLDDIEGAMLHITSKDSFKYL